MLIFQSHHFDIVFAPVWDDFVGKQNIRSLDEFPIITDFCHKYCTIKQIFENLHTFEE